MLINFIKVLENILFKDTNYCEMLKSRCLRFINNLDDNSLQMSDFLCMSDNLSLTSIICFTSGVLTVVLNRNNLLITLLGVELVLLSANIIFIFGSFIHNDAQGFVYVLCILTVSAVETGLGIAVLVFAYGTTSNTNYTKLNTLKN